MYCCEHQGTSFFCLIFIQTRFSLTTVRKRVIICCTILFSERVRVTMRENVMRSECDSDFSHFPGVTRNISSGDLAVGNNLETVRAAE